MNDIIRTLIDAVLLLGPTGVGKSPLGETLSQNSLFGRICLHLDFGAELRAAIGIPERSTAYTKEDLALIRAVLEQGLLLENEYFILARKIISLFLDRSGYLPGSLLILNGIPRHIGQARDMSSIARIHAIIVLDCSIEDVFYRLKDNAGGDRNERVDDDRELVEKKLVTFRERTAPLIDYYRATGSAVYHVPVTGTMTPEETFRCLSALAAAHPPISFIAKPPQ